MSKYFIGLLLPMAVIVVPAMSYATSCTDVMRDLNDFLLHAERYGLGVKFIAQQLANIPKSDTSVDNSLVSLLPGGSGVQQWERNFLSDSDYSLVELAILKRNARGLSSIPVDLRYTTKALKHRLKSYYLEEILEFHEEFDLRKFKNLDRIVAANCVDYPETLKDFSDSRSWKAVVDKFKAELGIGMDSPRQ